MCLPALAWVAIAAVASMATSYVTIQHNNKTAEALAENANNATEADYSAVNEQEREVNEQTTLDILERSRQGLRERAKMRVAAGESGLAGVTPIREQANSMLQQSYDIGIYQTNNENKIAQGERQKKQIYAQGGGRINEANSRVTDSLMAGLQIAGAGLSSASSIASIFKGAGGGGTPTKASTLTNTRNGVMEGGNI